MFNFFDEIKKKSESDFLCEFNIVNVSGKMVYIEGHLGLIVMTSSMIACKVKSGRIVVEGENLFLGELTDNTMLIKGKIVKVEQF